MTEQVPTRDAIRTEARAIRGSAVIYDKEHRMRKYTVLLIAERLGYIKEAPVAFPKKRCKPPLTEEEITQAHKDRDTIIEAIRASEENIKALVKTMPDCDDDIHEEALRILKEEDIFEYFIVEYRKRHVGNEKTMKIMLVALICPNVESTQGVNPKASGVKGTGKSTGIYAAVFLFHQKFVLLISCSSKALYYATIPAGCIIVLDDTSPPDDMIDMVKRKMSVDFHRESVHITVVDGKPEKKTMPPGVVFVFTSVTDSKSDQLIDRQFIVALDKNDELDRQYSKFALDLAGEGYKDLKETRETLICREITRILKEKEYQVTVPFSDRIQFSVGAMRNRRAVGTFLDILRTHATIYSHRRVVVDGMIQATTDDFQFAVDIMDIGEIRYSLKLTKSEEAVWKYIKVHPNTNQNAIANALGVGKSWVSRIFHGEGRNNSGLADKAPLSFEDVYDRDTGVRERQWITTGDIEEREPFATLKPE